MQLLRKRRPRAEWVFCLGLLAVLVCWAFASPNGSTQDNDFHMSSIFCAGMAGGPCEVPALAATTACFSLGPRPAQGDMTPACVDQSLVNKRSEARIYNTSQYSGGFYAFMHLFSGGSLMAVVFRVRLISAFIFIGLLSSSIWIAKNRPDLRRAIVGAIIGTFVPLGLWFIPSVNQTSWSFLSTSMIWIPALICFDPESGIKRKYVAVGLVSLCLAIAVASKPEAIFYCAAALISVATLTVKFSKRFFIKAIIVCGALALSLKFVLANTNATELLSNGFENTSGQYFSPYYLTHNIPHLIDLYFGDFATNFGDSDIFISPTSWLFASLSLFGLIAIGVRQMWWRKFFILISNFVLVCLVPLLILNKSNRQVGARIATRYVWPLMFGLVLVFLVEHSKRRTAYPRLPVAVVCLAAHFAATGSLFAAVHRYTVGDRSTSWNLDADKLWWWGNAPISPLGLLAIAFVAQCFMFGAAYRVLTRNDGAILVGQAA